MERDFKISEIPEQGIDNLTDLSQMSSLILIPSSLILGNNITNYTIDLVRLASIIISYVDTIPSLLLDLIKLDPDLRALLAQIVGGVTPGSDDNLGLSGGNSLTLEALAARVTELENGSNWPTNYITIKNGNISVPYALPTGFRESGVPLGDIVIETSSARLPNLYLLLTISSSTVNNGSARIEASLTVSNFYDTLMLRGTNNTSLGSIKIFGSIITNNSLAYEILTEQISDLKFPDAYNGGDTKSQPITITLTNNSLPSNATISKVSLKCSIRDVEMNGSAELYAPSTSHIGTGYITLS